jgi:hypothetical protein
MGPHVSFPISDARTKTAILDTNLILLMVSTRVGLHRFGSFARVKAFTIDDARLLLWILSHFKGVATTAYVLAEVSNLANKLSGTLRDEWFTELAKYAIVTDEAHVPTQVVGAKSETIRFGIADSALSHLSQNYTVITAEFRLSGYLEKLGREVLNFNHLRHIWMTKK